MFYFFKGKYQINFLLSLADIAFILLLSFMMQPGRNTLYNCQSQVKSDIKFTEAPNLPGTNSDSLRKYTISILDYEILVINQQKLCTTYKKEKNVKQKIAVFLSGQLKKERVNLLIQAPSNMDFLEVMNIYQYFKDIENNNGFVNEVSLWQVDK